MHRSGSRKPGQQAAHPIRILYVDALRVRIKLQHQLLQVEEGPLVSGMLPYLWVESALVTACRFSHRTVHKAHTQSPYSGACSGAHSLLILLLKQALDRSWIYGSWCT